MHGRAAEEPFPLELAAVWLLYLLDATAMLVTYSRLPADQLYHVSGSGLLGGASRVLVFLDFPVALAAIAAAALVADRLGGRGIPAAALSVVLSAVIFWPGIVTQADLDARPVNAVPAAGVV